MTTLFSDCNHQPTLTFEATGCSISPPRTWYHTRTTGTHHWHVRQGKAHRLEAHSSHARSKANTRTRTFYHTCTKAMPLERGGLVPFRVSSRTDKLPTMPPLVLKWSSTPCAVVENASCPTKTMCGLPLPAPPPPLPPPPLPLPPAALARFAG